MCWFFLSSNESPVEQKAPSYPSSSQRAKNWDKIEAEIKKDEKTNKEDAGDANAYVVFPMFLINMISISVFF